MTAVWNVVKAWLVTAVVAGLAGLLGYVIGELRLASIFAFAGLLLCLSTYWMADRAIMGMLGARELPEGEAPDLHAVVARLAARAHVVKPRLYVIDRGPPLGLAAGRGVWSSTIAFTMGLLALPPAEVEGVLAHELAHVRNRDIVIQTPVVLFSSALLDLSRIGGFLERALLYVLGTVRGGVRAHPPVAEAGVRGRSSGCGDLRVAARARRCAHTPGAGSGARRVPGQPGLRAAVHHQPAR